ncbi:hypothetical protein F0Q45_10565, partial [Mycobacterium simiae]
MSAVDARWGKCGTNGALQHLGQLFGRGRKSLTIRETGYPRAGFPPAGGLVSQLFEPEDDDGGYYRHAYRTAVRWVPRSIVLSSVPTHASTMG